MIERINQIDFSILYWIQNTLKCRFLDYIMPPISALGNIGLIWIICAFIMIIAAKHRRAGIVLLSALTIGAVISSVVMKPTFARPRPCWLDPAVKLLINVPKDYSFPSGHTMASVISATVLTLYNRRLGYAAIVLAAFISFSRLYLFVHFPTDVLTSVILGIVIGFAFCKLGNRLIGTLPKRKSGK